jgi:hypothetical protein
MNSFKGVKQNTDRVDNEPGGNQVKGGFIGIAGFFLATHNWLEEFLKVRSTRDEAFPISDFVQGCLWDF